MDWVDRFADAVATPLRDKQPAYWHNGLIKHLDLPDKWPSDWDKVELQEKAYVLFLESFDPPENLQGLAHQLTPLRHVLLKLADNKRLNSNERSQLSSLLDLFIEQVEDYINISPKDEQKVFKANKLSHIKQLGLWRFHFHCSQVNRKKIDLALNLAKDVLADKQQAIIIRASKIDYLRDGPLEDIYEAIAAELHLWLRRKLREKRNGQSKGSSKASDNEVPETESTEKKHHDIYTEAVACEHCIHLAHYLLKAGNQGKDLKGEIFDAISTLSDPKDMKDFVSDLPPSAATAVIKISFHIKSVNNLITTMGGYTKRKRSSKENYTPRNSTHSGRLLPPGRYEEVVTDKTTQRVQIDNPLNIINGIFDDACDEGFLHRRYGQRPKTSDECGESEDDYKRSETVDIPASWLVDPYRNAIKQRVQMESLIIHQEPPVWSSQCLRVETIKQYLLSLSSTTKDVSLLASLAFYTGLTEPSMRSIKLEVPELFNILDSSVAQESKIFSDLAAEAESSKWSDIYLDIKRLEYVYLLPKDSIAYYSEQSPDFIRNCEPASRLVRVSLPEVLKQLFESYLEELAYDSSVIPEDPFEPSSHAKLFMRWEKTERGWKDLMADVGRRCHENVTPARIRATFRALFVGQAGLAPLHANLIMIEIPIRYRAQHFYSNINGSLLKQQYHDACRSIQKTLRIDTKSQGEGSEVASYVPKKAARFGSRLVPATNALSEYFKKSHALFIHDVTAVAWHPETWNTMMLYIFRLLQLSTGMRPVRDSLPPKWPDISFQTRTVLLSDKDSPQFNESRIIPMATALFQWLGFLARLQKKYFIATNFHLKNVMPPYRNQPTGSMFSYFDTEHKVIRPFSIDDIDRLEDENKLSSAFPFKPNALRHNLLTRLNENNVDQHIIDFIMGHKHFGSEVFGRFSPVSSLQYTRLATKALDEFLIQPLEIPLPPAYA